MACHPDRNRRIIEEDEKDEDDDSVMFVLSDSAAGGPTSTGAVPASEARSQPLSAASSLVIPHNESFASGSSSVSGDVRLPVSPVAAWVAPASDFPVSSSFGSSRSPISTRSESYVTAAGGDASGSAAQADGSVIDGAETGDNAGSNAGSHSGSHSGSKVGDAGSLFGDMNSLFGDDEANIDGSNVNNN